ncbi:MAG: hypothetical protein BMS9Abin14_602 [Gammaproteobacteria bacterium]|nr:MAG: hypothetical protein BMS9Abin14_602 [Gammaproteobacteria bacterium]
MPITCGACECACVANLPGSREAAARGLPRMVFPEIDADYAALPA